MPSPARSTYAFGPFALDPVERRLLRNGRPLPVLPKSLDVLVALVERHGHLVTKEELLTTVWAGAVVEENVLSVAVSRLRATLEDPGRQGRYIETVTGYGYRFVAEVVENVRDAGDSLPLSESLPLTEVVVPEIRTVPPPPGARTTRSAWPVLGLAVVLALGVAAALWVSQTESPVASGSETVPAGAIGPPSNPRTGSAASLAQAVYLEGRALWARRDNATHAAAVDRFRYALQLDSTYALAYVGLADVYALRHLGGEEAERAVEAALGLDPELGEAWATLGFIRTVHYWDWSGAEEAFRRALALAPDYVTAHQWYATLLMIQRRFDEAEAALERAHALAPDYVPVLADRCQLLYYRRFYDDALAACEEALRIEPNYQFVLQRIFWIHLLADRPEAAADWWLARLYSRDAFPWRPTPDMDAGSLLRALIDHLTGMSHPGVAAEVALLHAALGDREAALDAAWEATEVHAFWAPFINADPVFWGLRGDPRFRAILERMGLAP